jgi:hypothetical protein
MLRDGPIYCLLHFLTSSKSESMASTISLVDVASEILLLPDGVAIFSSRASRVNFGILADSLGVLLDCVSESIVLIN